MYKILSIIISLSIVFTPIHANYINTRDITVESLKIQRLLGKLDTFKIISKQQSTSSDTSTQLAMLSMITSGLMLTASSSYYRVPYRTSYNHYSHRRQRNRVGVSIGTTMATAGLIGMIAASASDNVKNQAVEQQVAEQEKIQKEINTIISNLVSTDTDYLTEELTLNNTLSKSVDKNIKDINRRIENDIFLLKNKVQQKEDDFIKLSNDIIVYIEKLNSNTIKMREQNIKKIANSNTSKIVIKELKKLNKEIKKITTKKEKQLYSQLKEEKKKFEKTFPNYQEEIVTQINLLEKNKNTNILIEVENAEKKTYDLFQKYITMYIKKLSIY
ncbi:MAG: hypothetical protein KFW21_02800 [Spirochaetota bacterium]|nr:hypothetical protein [Spirochaetota bacterium]